MSTRGAQIRALEPRRGWRRALKTAVRDPDELARLLDLPLTALRERALAASEFPLLVPRGFVARMRRRDLNDPLLLQVLPSVRERIDTPGFVADPLAERARTANGVISKYAGRVLLIASGACPIHCRYCFRREFPYAEQLAARAGWRAALDAIAADREIREVILSGGDPLSLSNRRLRALLAKLEQNAHVECLRVHTRFPVTIPERVNAGLLELLSATRLKTVVVIHANHPNELDEAVAAALLALKPHTDLLLNQSVLLAGINDTEHVLSELSRRLFACGVMPYYLHLLDPVTSTAHFDVDEPRAVELVERCRARLPGYLVPKLVREIPGGLSKTLVG